MAEKTPNLTFNILTFTHPADEFTFHFVADEAEGLNRVHNSLVPTEVIEHFGKQEHYFTSFDNALPNSFAVTKPCTPSYTEKLNKQGEKVRAKDENSCYGFSILKRYYNFKVYSYFKSNGYIVSPNFIKDTEVWLPSEKLEDWQYRYFDKFTLKIQIARITSYPELIISFESTAKVFKKSLAALYKDVAPEKFTWVIYNEQLYRHSELPEEARRYPENSFPVWNFDIRSALNQGTEAPERGNKYLKFRNHITKFYNNHLNNDNFKAVIPLHAKGFIPVDEVRKGKVSFNSNSLIFGKKDGVVGRDISPITGMNKWGPYDIGDFQNVHIFFIFHKSDFKKAENIQKYFDGEFESFKGLQKYSHINYHFEKNFSFMFDDKDNPLPKVEELLRQRKFQDDVKYFAIYISPHSKTTNDEKRKAIYYKLKELLLKNKILSQVLDAEKILNPKVKYHNSLPNIAIAMLAKLNGIPWRLDTQIKNELIVGVGAFKHVNSNVQYIGSAFSFQNTGKFTHFECFRKNEIDELAGSILDAVRAYVVHNKSLKKLVIHFYKSMNQDELQPIEDGLKELRLEIPVFIVSINKTESTDFVAFDEDYSEIMPLSGTYINIGFNRYLLFNNSRYNNYPVSGIAGYPFPIKLSISCSNKELEKDTKVIGELLDQVYQFSRVYWKSLIQQNLPVTIKYPEMVAEMFPYFDGYEIPEFGKDNLWFL